MGLFLDADYDDMDIGDFSLASEAPGDEDPQDTENTEEVDTEEAPEETPEEEPTDEPTEDVPEEDAPIDEEPETEEDAPIEEDPAAEGEPEMTEEELDTANTLKQFFINYRYKYSTIEKLIETVTDAIPAISEFEDRRNLRSIIDTLLIMKGQVDFALHMKFTADNLEKISDIYTIIDKKLEIIMNNMDSVIKISKK